MTRMSAPALPESARPEVWLWREAMLYLGPSLDPDLHAGSVPCLAVGLDGALSVERASGSLVDARSVLIDPGILHRVRAEGRVAFLYLDPRSGRAERCRALMEPIGGGLASGHAQEMAAMGLLGPPGRSDVETALELLAPRSPLTADPRVRSTLRRLAVVPGTSAEELAQSVGLSRSRLLHLFTRDVGMPLRRYRTWSRVRQVALSIRAGSDLTRAAADAGFASPSHFSDAFRSMFGMPASRLLARGVRVHVVDQADEPPATS